MKGTSVEVLQTAAYHSEVASRSLVALGVLASTVTTVAVLGGERTNKLARRSAAVAVVSFGASAVEKLVAMTDFQLADEQQAREAELI